MRKSARELIDQLNKTDEYERIEAKRCKSGNPGKSVRKTVSAFSNEPGLGGGHIVFGVFRNDGEYEVVGVDDPDKLQTDFNSQCSTLYNIQVRPSLSVEQVDGKNVVVARVPEVDPEKKPVYLEATGLPKGAYRRIGAADQRCTEEDVEELFALRNADEFDMTLSHDATLDDIDESALDEYREAVRENNPESEILDWDDGELLRALRCVRRDEDGEFTPTVAGVLLFGEKWSLRRLFPSMYVDYIRVKGTEWVEDPERRYEDAVEVREPLVRAVREVTAKVVEDLPTPFSLDRKSLQRKDDPVIPVSVVREAVANALMHRSYRERGASQIIRYDNRIEVRNPGHSLKPRERLHEPGSQLRNPTIANVLREMGFAENKGSGIQTMRRLMSEANLTPPTFESNRRANRFVATFLFQHFLSNDDVRWLQKIQAVESDDAAAIALIYIRETGRIDNEKLRDLADLETLEASQILGRLRDADLLEMQGSGVATYYTPGPTFPDSMQGTRDDAQGEGQLELSPDEEREVNGTDDQRPNRRGPHSKPQSSGAQTQSSTGKTQSSEAKTQSSEAETQSSTAETQSSGKNTASELRDKRDQLLAELPDKLVQEIRDLPNRAPSERIEELLTKVCSIRPYKSGELSLILDREQTSISRKLSTLTQEGQLERSHPDSPRHPNQSYFTPEQEDGRA